MGGPGGGTGPAAPAEHSGGAGGRTGGRAQPVVVDGVVSDGLSDCAPSSGW